MQGWEFGERSILCWQKEKNSFLVLLFLHLFPFCCFQVENLRQSNYWREVLETGICQVFLTLWWKSFNFLAFCLKYISKEMWEFTFSRAETWHVIIMHHSMSGLLYFWLQSCCSVLFFFPPNYLLENGAK